MGEVIQTGCEAPIQIGNSDSQVVLTPEDYDRFVMTQRQVLEACGDRLELMQKQRKLSSEFEQSIAAMANWCLSRAVSECAITPRVDDILVTVVASNEDPDGTMHDEMCALDLALFDRNKIRFYWLLLRSSEAAGLDAFSNVEARKRIYSAKPVGA